MTRTTRSTAAGRQLAIAVPLDAWTLIGLPVTPDEDCDQMDLLEFTTELESSSRWPAPGSTLVLATASEQATVVLVAVIEKVTLKVPAWHANCSGCPTWRCHRQAHDDAGIALRCAQQHADRKHTPAKAGSL